MSSPSEEINFLIHKYMQELGFQHSAFVFGAESNISQSNINGEGVSKSALLEILRKGLLYTKIEQSIREDGRIVSAIKELRLIDAAMPENDGSSVVESLSTANSKNVSLASSADSNISDETSSNEHNLGVTVKKRTSVSKNSQPHGFSKRSNSGKEVSASTILKKLCSNKPTNNDDDLSIRRTLRDRPTVSKKKLSRGSSKHSNTDKEVSTGAMPKNSLSASFASNIQRACASAPNAVVSKYLLRSSIIRR